MPSIKFPLVQPRQYIRRQRSRSKMALLMRAGVQWYLQQVRNASRYILPCQKAWHIRAFLRPGAVRNTDSTNRRRSLQDLFQTVRELLYMMEHRITLTQAQLSGLYRQQLLL